MTKKLKNGTYNTSLLTRQDEGEGEEKRKEGLTPLLNAR
jgi:hypothetical protein